LTRDPSTTFEGDGKQTTWFTVQVQDAGARFVLYVPVTCYGRCAEQAATLSAEDLVAVQGRLGWKTYEHHGEKRSTLCVLAQTVSVLQSAALPA
jgi:single-stranded DNA-binding protein